MNPSPLAAFRDLPEDVPVLVVAHLEEDLSAGFAGFAWPGRVRRQRFGDPLLALPALQALGAAAGLACGFHVLTAGPADRQRLWTAVAILGSDSGRDGPRRCADALSSRSACAGGWS